MEKKYIPNLLKSSDHILNGFADEKLYKTYSTSLLDYIKVYDVFDYNFVSNVLEEIKDINWNKHYYYNLNADQTYQYDDDLYQSSDEFKSRKTIHEKIWFLIKQYLDDIDLKWYDSWNGYSNFRLNRYDINTNMKLHCDHITNLFDGERKGVPSLSVLGSLSTQGKDYEGGDLILCNKKLELNAGSVVIFPSNFLYPHKVTNIIKGVRYSFVSWVF